MKGNKIEFDKNTLILKELFKKVENSGKIAWQIGDLLLENHKQKLYRNKYNTFDDFTRAEFEKTEQTARVYMHIRERFDSDDITENMLVTHLKTIADFENHKVGNMVLKALDTVYVEQENTKKVIPSIKDIDLSLKLLSEKDTLNEKEAIQTLKAVTKESKELTSEKKKRKKEDKFGNKLISEGIPNIATLFENEPIDEMGTVALFCVLFPFIKGMEFILENEKLSFESFQYVRSPFPDSSIRVKQIHPKKSQFKYIKIEFEFESYNFVKHNHHNKNENTLNECKLIICWKDNIIKNNVIPVEFKEKLPKIIEISNILKTGKIDVIDLGKVY